MFFALNIIPAYQNVSNEEKRIITFILDQHHRYFRHLGGPAGYQYSLPGPNVIKLFCS
jgi:hypothetical protein